MHAKSENGNQLEPNSHRIPPSTIVPQPWWRDVGYNTTPSVALGENASKTSLVEPPDSGMGTKTSQSRGDDGLGEGTGVAKKIQATVMPQSGSDGKIVQQHQHLQHVVSTIPPTGGEFLVPHNQLELVGHSVACSSYPYSDPYYGGIMAAYGTQSMAHPHLLGMQHSRMPLPLEMAEEPVYVNAKQYHGILRRRQSRAKAEVEKKLIKNRKPYLHESRHQHAMRRARGCGGRFLNTKKLQSNSANPTPEKGTGSDAAPSNPRSSTGSESLPSDHTRNLDSLSGQQEIKGLLGQEMQESHTYSSGDGDSNACYQHHQEFRLSTFSPLTSERGDEDDYLGQQRGSIAVSQAPHRALTIQ